MLDWPVTRSAMQTIAALHLRSYGQREEPDRHPYAQLVLPVAGTVLLDIEGSTGCVDALHAGVVPPGAWHSQCADGDNRSIIVDIDREAVAAGAWQRVMDRPFAVLDPAVRKLVDFMAIVGGQGAVPPAVLQGWVPLLLDTLAAAPPQPLSRLAALCARIAAEPGLPWTTAAMARSASVSVRRLHALFREEFDTTPHAWLLRQRLDSACAWLARDGRPIAQVALAAGFSDQSALTRAMRDTLGTTPAAYRQQTASRR